jgi:hypothetical protein
VITLVDEPSAVSVVVAAVTVEVAALAASVTNCTDAVLLIGVPFSVALIVAVETIVDDVRVAVYVPLLLSTMVDNDPDVVVASIASPPVVRGFPNASRTSIVIVDVLVPSAVIFVGDAINVVCEALAAPGTNVTVSLSVMVTPPTVPVMVDVPAVVEEVNVAV